MLQGLPGAQPLLRVDDQERGDQVFRLVADALPDLVLEVVELASPDEAEELGLVLRPEGLVAVFFRFFFVCVVGEKAKKGGEREREREREKNEKKRKKLLTLRAA